MTLAMTIPPEELGVVYHGSNEFVREVDPSRLQRRDYGFYGEGFYVSQRPDYAKVYGGRISKFRFRPGAKIMRASLGLVDAPDGLLDEVMDWYYRWGEARAQERGKLEEWNDEVMRMQYDHLAWKRAILAYATAPEHDYDAIWWSPGEIVVRRPEVLESVLSKPRPARQAAALLLAVLDPDDPNYVPARVPNIKQVEGPERRGGDGTPDMIPHPHNDLTVAMALRLLDQAGLKMGRDYWEVARGMRGWAVRVKDENVLYAIERAWRGTEVGFRDIGGMAAEPTRPIGGTIRIGNPPARGAARGTSTDLVLYHGTNEAVAERILAEGLRAGSSLAQRPETSERFGPVVLAVNVSGMDVQLWDAWSGQDRPAAEIVLERDDLGDGYAAAEVPIPPDRIRVHSRSGADGGDFHLPVSAARLPIPADDWWSDEMLDRLLSRVNIQDSRIQIVRAIAVEALSRLGPSAAAWGDRAVADLVAKACDAFRIQASVAQGQVTIDGQSYPHTWVSFAEGGMLDLMPVGHWAYRSSGLDLDPEDSTFTEDADEELVGEVVRKVRHDLGIAAVAAASTGHELDAGILEAPPRMVEAISTWAKAEFERIVRENAPPSSAMQRFPIDLGGWRYVEDPAAAQATLAAAGLASVLVQMMPWSMPSAERGLWTGSAIQLQPDAAAAVADPRLIGPWQDELERVIRHELVHAAQDWMQALGMGTAPGGPPNPNPATNQALTDPMWHSLRDEEFQPLLDSWSDRIAVELSRSFPVQVRRQRLRSILMGEDDRYRGLRILRKNDPERWQRAVREITKAVSGRVEMPGLQNDKLAPTGAATPIRPRPSWLEGLPDEVASELWKEDLELDRRIRERKRNLVEDRHEAYYRAQFEALDSSLPPYFEWVGDGWSGRGPDGVTTTVTPSAGWFLIEDDRPQADAPEALTPELALDRALDRFTRGDEAGPALQPPGGGRGAAGFRTADEVLEFLRWDQQGRAKTAALRLVAYRAIRFIVPRDLSGYHAFQGIVEGDRSEFTPPGETRADNPFNPSHKLVTTGEDEIHVADPVGTLQRLIQAGRRFEVEWQDGMLNVIDGYADRFHTRLESGQSVFASIESGKVEIIVESPHSTTLSPAFRGLVRDLSSLAPQLRFFLQGGLSRTPLPAAEFLATLSAPDAALGRGTLTLWHGTTTRFFYAAEARELDATLLGGEVRPIETFGLQPPRATGAMNWIGPEGSPHAETYAGFIYLATDSNTAEWYGQRAAKIYGGRAIVLRVQIPDPALLVPDDDYLIANDKPADQGSALASLTKFGQVAYAGRIPVKFVQVAWEQNRSDRPGDPGAAERVPLYRELYVLVGAAMAAIQEVLPDLQWLAQSGRLRGITHTNAVENAGMRPWEDFGSSLGDVAQALGRSDSKEQAAREAAVAKAQQEIAALPGIMQAIEPYVRDLEKILEDTAPALEPLTEAWFPGKARASWVFNALDRIDVGRLPDEEADRIDARVYDLATAGQIAEDWPYSSQRRDAYDAATEWYDAFHRAERALEDAEIGTWDPALVSRAIRSVTALHKVQDVRRRFAEALPRAQADMVNVERRVKPYEEARNRYYESLGIGVAAAAADDELYIRPDPSVPDATESDLAAAARWMGAQGITIVNRGWFPLSKVEWLEWGEMEPLLEGYEFGEALKTEETFLASPAAYALELADWDIDEATAASLTPETLTPIVLARRQGDMSVVDGVHRLCFAKAMGWSEVRAVIVVRNKRLVTAAVLEDDELASPEAGGAAFEEALRQCERDSVRSAYAQALRSGEAQPLLEAVAFAEKESGSPGTLRLYRAVSMGSRHPDWDAHYEAPYQGATWNKETERWDRYEIPRGVGVSWSAAPWGAYPYLGRRRNSVGEERCLVADVPLSSVDFPVTLELFTNHGTWGREIEVRAREGAPMQLVGWWELAPKADQEATWRSDREATFVPFAMPVTAAADAESPEEIVITEDYSSLGKGFMSYYFTTAANVDRSYRDNLDEISFNETDDPDGVTDGTERVTDGDPNAKVLWVDEMDMRRDRGRGMGRELLEATLEYAREQGAVAVYLQATRASHGFWSYMGFDELEDDGYVTWMGMSLVQGVTAARLEAPSDLVAQVQAWVAENVDTDAEQRFDAGEGQEILVRTYTSAGEGVAALFSPPGAESDVPVIELSGPVEPSAVDHELTHYAQWLVRQQTGVPDAGGPGSVPTSRSFPYAARPVEFWPQVQEAASAIVRELQRVPRDRWAVTYASLLATANPNEDGYDPSAPAKLRRPPVAGDEAVDLDPLWRKMVVEIDRTVRKQLGGDAALLAGTRRVAGARDDEPPRPDYVIYCYTCETYSEDHGEGFCEPCGSDHIVKFSRANVASWRKIESAIAADASDEGDWPDERLGDDASLLARSIFRAREGRLRRQGAVGMPPGWRLYAPDTWGIDWGSSWRLTARELYLSIDLPPQPPIPDQGDVAFLRTDDGGIYTAAGARTHVQIAEALGVPPWRVKGGGWLKDGVELDLGFARSTDAEGMGEVSRATLRSTHKRAIFQAITRGEPVPDRVLTSYPGRFVTTAQRAAAPPEVLFHGTTSALLPEIEEAGYLRMPYLTSSHEIAADYAASVAGELGGDPVVIEVPFDALNPDLLRADRRSYDEPIWQVKQRHGIQSDDEWFEALKDGRLPPSSRLDWRTSLEVVDAVDYQGTVPFRYLTITWPNEKTAAIDERWLYHGTTSDRIAAIQARGLLPSSDPNQHWTPRLREHSRDRVFFARDPWEALKFAEMHIDVLEDDPLAVPVVLRVPWGVVYAGVGDTDNPDPLAQNSVRTEEAIPPEYIEMSIRGRWRPIRDVAPDEIPWVGTRSDGWAVDQRGRPLATHDRNISTRNLLWDLGMRSLPEARPDDWSPQPLIRGPINAQRDEGGGTSRPLAEDEMAEVRAHEDNSLSGPVDAFSWTFEMIPTSSLGWSKEMASKWFEEELEAERAEEFRHVGYLGELAEWWLANPFAEPIVVTESDQGNLPGHDIWDGWHRSAIAIVNGVSEIPAFVGRPRGITAQRDEGVPRVWISPDGREIPVDSDTSHGASSIELLRAMGEEVVEPSESDDDDVEVDWYAFLTGMITRLEKLGWVRASTPHERSPRSRCVADFSFARWDHRTRMLISEFCERRGFRPESAVSLELDQDGLPYAARMRECSVAELDQSGDIFARRAARDEGGEMSRDESGQVRWGRRAAGLLIVRGDGRVLLTLRSPDVMDPETWGIPGGRVEPGESEWQGALGETKEELGSLPPVRKLGEHVYRSGDFTYTTFTVEMDEADAEGFEATLNWENDDWGWFALGNLPAPLHPGVAAVLPGVGRTAAATDDASPWLLPQWFLGREPVELLDSQPSGATVRVRRRSGEIVRVTESHLRDENGRTLADYVLDRGAHSTWWPTDKPRDFIQPRTLYWIPSNATERQDALAVGVRGGPIHPAYREEVLARFPDATADELDGPTLVLTTQRAPDALWISGGSMWFEGVYPLEDEDGQVVVTLIGQDLPPGAFRPIPQARAATALLLERLAQSFVPPPAMVESAAAIAVDDYLSQVVARSRERLSAADIDPEVRANLEELIPYAQSLLSNRETFQPTAQNPIPIDLSGWRYVPDDQQASVAEALGRARRGMPLLRIVTWQPKYAASHEAHSNTITISCPIVEDDWSLGQSLEWIRRVIPHELTHWAQFALAWIQKMPGLQPLGLPSPNIRDPETSPSGWPRGSDSDDPTRTRTEHPMRDIEFWPILNDAVDAFLSGIKSSGIPRRLWRKELREVLNGAPIWGSGVVNPLGVWMQEDPDRWRRGVRGFVNRLQEIAPDDFRSFYGKPGLPERKGMVAGQRWTVYEERPLARGSLGDDLNSARPAITGWFLYRHAPPEGFPDRRSAVRWIMTQWSPDLDRPDMTDQDFERHYQAMFRNLGHYRVAPVGWPGVSSVPHVAATEGHRYVVDQDSVAKDLGRADARSRAQDAVLFEDEGKWWEQVYEDVPIEQVMPEEVWNPSRYERARQALEQGIPIPPIRLSEVQPGVLAIEDGIHRYNAAKDLGFESIPALVSRIRTTAPEVPPQDVASARFEAEGSKVWQGIRNALPEPWVRVTGDPAGYHIDIDLWIQAAGEERQLAIDVRAQGDQRQVTLELDGFKATQEVTAGAVPAAVLELVRQAGLEVRIPRRGELEATAARPIPRAEADTWNAGSALPGPYYHGTDDPTYDEIDARPSDYVHGGSIGPGIYVSQDPENGAGFYGDHVFEVRLNVRNPLSIDDNGIDTSPDAETARIRDELFDPESATHARYLEWLVEWKEDEVRDIIAQAEGVDSDEAIDEILATYAGTDPRQMTFEWAPPPVTKSGLELYIQKHLERFDSLQEEFVSSEVDAMEVGDSVLIGEQVSPFYLSMGDKTYTIGFKRPDRPDFLEIDMDEVGPEAQANGYDAVVWDARYPAGETLVFDPANVAIIEDTLSDDLRPETARPVTAARLRWPALESRISQAFQTAYDLVVVPPDAEAPPESLSAPWFMTWAQDDFPDVPTGSDPRDYALRYVESLRDELIGQRSANRVRLYRVTMADVPPAAGSAVGIDWTTAPSSSTTAAADVYSLIAEVPLNSIDWVQTVRRRIEEPLSNEVVLLAGAPVVVVQVEQGSGDQAQVVQDRPMTLTAQEEVPAAPDPQSAPAPAISREAVFQQFLDAIAHVWGPKTLEFLRSSVRLGTEKPREDILAAVAYRGQPRVIGDTLVRRALSYELRLADRALELAPDAMWRLLVHEAVHVGIPMHGDAFKKLCLAKGGAVSERGVVDASVRIELWKKVGPRYQPFEQFDREEDARNRADQLIREDPTARFRITM